MGVGDWPVGILCPGVPVKERTRKEKDVSPFLSTLSSAFSGSSSFAVQFLVLVSPIHLPGWNTSVHENGSVPLRTTIFAPRCRKYTATPTRPPLIFFSYFLIPFFFFSNSGKGVHSDDPAGRRLHYDYGVHLMKGKRPYMEDRHVVHGMLGGEDVSLYGVFDGHGGSEAAQYCKDQMGKALVKAVNFPQQPEKALTEAILGIDKDYLRSANVPPYRDDGTTLIVAMTQGKTITVANVGDSRAVLVKCDGSVDPLSYDHKPNGDSEKARIESLGGKVVFWGVWRVEGVLAVSRAIGDRMLKKYVSAQPDFLSVEVTHDDTYMVIASDGLWDVIENDEVGRLCSKIKNASKAAIYLANEAYKRGSADNICVLVVDLRTGEQVDEEDE